MSSSADSAIIAAFRPITVPWTVSSVIQATTTPQDLFANTTGFEGSGVRRLRVVNKSDTEFVTVLLSLRATAFTGSEDVDDGACIPPMGVFDTLIGYGCRIGVVATDDAAINAVVSDV